MTAPIGSPVRSAKRAGSIFSPAFFNSAASDGICCGIHIPSAPNTAVVAASARIPIKNFFTRSPSVVRWDQIERDAIASRIQSLSTAYRRRSFPRLTGATNSDHAAARNDCLGNIRVGRGERADTVFEDDFARIEDDADDSVGEHREMS